MSKLTISASLVGVVAIGSIVVGCGQKVNNSSNQSSQKASSKKYTITVQLQQSTGNVSSSQNAPLVADAKKYEKLHPNVTIKFLANPYTTVTQANAALVTKASGGKAPDVVWEEAGQAVSGAVPKGILRNLAPYLNQPDPYVKGNKKWVSLWNSNAVANMRSSNGDIYILLGSDVATEIVYNKADFKAAGINAIPSTFAKWVTDMKKLKAAGFQPFLLADASGQNVPAWWEKEVMSTFLQKDLSKFDVNHSSVATGVDLAVGIKKGIISMNNPAYAETWKLLSKIKPYIAKGSTAYDATASLSSTTPPLSPVPAFVQNKFAMTWLGSWDLPDLNKLGFKGKYGFFPFPKITSASSNLPITNVGGIVGGPFGVGEWSVTTQKADSTMTAAKAKQVMNFLMYLYTPQNEGAWVAAAGNNSYVPVIKGAKVSGVAGLSGLLPKGNYTTIDGPLAGSFTNSAETLGTRIFQNFLSDGMSYNQFSKQWETMLQQQSVAWAKANKVNLSKY